MKEQGSGRACLQVPFGITANPSADKEVWSFETARDTTTEESRKSCRQDDEL
jgi:hypothetical protein